MEFSNSTYDDNITPGRSAGAIAHEVIFVIFCIFGICADAAIAYTILRFNRMRTIPNIWLLNWAIADICYLVIAPSGYAVISVFNNISMSREFDCGLLHFGSVLHLTVVLFVIIVAVDWFIAAYVPRRSQAIRNYQRHILGTLWITSMLSCGITTGLCITDIHTYLVLFLLLASNILLFIIIVILQSWRVVRKYYLKNPIEHSSLMLTMSTGFVASSTLGVFVICVTELIVYHPLISIAAECLVFSSSILNFIILYFSNRDFQACLIQTFKRSGSGYEDSINNFENPAYRNTAGKAVTVAYDKEDDLIFTNE